MGDSQCLVSDFDRATFFLNGTRHSGPYLSLWRNENRRRPSRASDDRRALKFERSLISSRCPLIARTVMPRAYIVMILSSNLVKHRWPFSTIGGSKLPSRYIMDAIPLSSGSAAFRAYAALSHRTTSSQPTFSPPFRSPPSSRTGYVSRPESQWKSCRLVSQTMACRSAF